MAVAPRISRPTPVDGLLVEAGELLVFTLRAFAALPGALRHFSEVLRQTRQQVVGGIGVLVFLMLCVGMTTSTFGAYFFRSIGAQDYVGLFTALSIPREAVPVMFGWVFAAKIGCGMTAEISTMKVAEELDAFRSVGIDPMRYVVATRILATMLFVPITFGPAVAAANLGAYIGAVDLAGGISPAAFEGAHWVLQNPQDIALGFLKVFVITVALTIVATYNGYRVVGGPVEVGTATARSMVLNLVLINAIDAVMSGLFWGSGIRLPIGG